MRGMARLTSARVMSNGSPTFLAQFMMVEPKQYTPMPAASSLRTARSNAASGMSWKLALAKPGTSTPARLEEFPAEFLRGLDLAVDAVGAFVADAHEFHSLFPE